MEGEGDVTQVGEEERLLDLGIGTVSLGEAGTDRDLVLSMPYYAQSTFATAFPPPLPPLYFSLEKKPKVVA